MPPKTIIIAFFTTHHALRAERVARAHGIACAPVPTPRTISADCTIALALNAADAGHAHTLFVANSVETQQIVYPSDAS